MLHEIREFANKKVVRFLFALFLVIPFGLFGIDYYFRGPVGGDALVSVGDQRISQVQFDQALRQQADLYRQQFGKNFDASLMENPEIRASVLDRLVNDRLLEEGARRAGARMGDRELAERIATEPAFQVDGRFSRERYEGIARSQGLTPVGLDERLREDYTQEKFRNSLVDTVILPKARLDTFIRLAEQSREVSLVNLDVAAYLPKVQVTPEQVKAYYDGHAPEFTTPEQVRVEFVELSLDALAAKAPVSPDDVKRIYEESVKAGRYGRPEERRASHVLVTVKAGAAEAEKKAAQDKAQAVADAVRKKPASFAEVAKKESQDPGSAAQGGDLGFFSRGAMVKPFEDAVFAAKKGDIVGPVASDFGFHVIHVTDIRPEKVKTLAEATPEIEAQVKKEAAGRKFAESTENFANVVYEQPTTLKPAADALGLEVRQSAWITKGQAAPPPLSNPKLVAEIFSADAIKNKRNTSAVEVAPNVLVAARVIEHRPPELRPLEGVRADIQRKLQREEALKLARVEGEARLKDLQAGKDAGLKWPATLAVSRQQPGGLFPQVLDKVFRVDAKKVPAYVGVETPAGYSLARVSKVIEVEKVDDAKRQALGAQLGQAVVLEEIEATLASLRERVGVRMKKDALAKKDTDSAPQSSAPPPPKPRGGKL